jgi:nicotinate-nucleotide pyrophosphorylase (carboxylating)
MIFNIGNTISCLGSALKFCKIAEGIYDYYPRFGPCCEWDTAAGACLSLDGVERVLCDNFSIADLAQAVRLSNGKLPLEASGNIDENTILAVAKTGVDYISTGSITKNIQAIDLSILNNLVSINSLA